MLHRSFNKLYSTWWSLDPWHEGIPVPVAHFQASRLVWILLLRCLPFVQLTVRSTFWYVSHWRDWWRRIAISWSATTWCLIWRVVLTCTMLTSRNNSWSIMKDGVSTSIADCNFFIFKRWPRITYKCQNKSGLPWEGFSRFWTPFPRFMSIWPTIYTFLLEGSYRQGIKYNILYHTYGIYIHINDTVDGKNPKTTTWDVL